MLLAKIGKGGENHVSQRVDGHFCGKLLGSLKGKWYGVDWDNVSQSISFRPCRVRGDQPNNPVYWTGKTVAGDVLFISKKITE